jgi:DNA-binding CsgD family transcriptional regulator
MTYDYFSPNVEEFTGYSPNDFKTGGLKFAMSLVHQDHVSIYSKELLPLMYKYIAMYVLKGRIKDLRFSYNFKIKNKSGNYMWAMHNMSIYKTNKWNIPLQFITYISDFSEFKLDDCITLCVSKKEMEQIKPILTKTFYPEKAMFKLTERELDILAKIMEGKTSLEIAQEFSLSIHTINTHRKNMLEKTQSKNISQLIEVFQKIRMGIKQERQEERR